MPKMKAAIFVAPGRIVLDEKQIPDVGPLDALMRITTTTICGTDVHILRGEYPVARGLTIGHEPVGVIEKLGSAVRGYSEGQRVIAGAICTRATVMRPCAAAMPRTAPGRNTVGKAWAAGSLATPLTVRRPSTSSCLTPWQTWLQCRTGWPTSRC